MEGEMCRWKAGRVSLQCSRLEPPSKHVWSVDDAKVTLSSGCGGSA